MTSVAMRACEALADRRMPLAEALVARQFVLRPDLELRYGARGREKCRQDALYHLAYLAEALAFDNQALFTDYVAWAKVMLHQRGVPEQDLAAHLEQMAGMLRTEIGGEPGALAADFVDDAVRVLPSMPNSLPTFLHDDRPLSLLAHQYTQALLRGERDVASRLVIEAVGRGTPVSDIYMQIFQPAQHEIGRLWQTNDISVAQEHYCTAATQLVISQLYPRLFTSERTGRTLVATCAAGELHELGARMVADFFEMAGWDTYYLGANTPHAGVIDALVERRADALAVSATITLHLGAVRTLIASVREHAGCASVKVLVGGDPFNRAPGLWRQVGADGTGRDAREAVAVAERLLSAGGTAASPP